MSNQVYKFSVVMVAELINKELIKAKDTGKREHIERAWGMFMALVTLSLLSAEKEKAIYEDIIRTETYLQRIRPAGAATPNEHINKTTN